MRKRARAVLTLLAMTAAFTLVGLMIGMNAGFDAIEAMTRSDRIFVNPRFQGLLPAAIGTQIAGKPGITAVIPVGEVWGYYQQERNNVYIALADLERSRRMAGDARAVADTAQESRWPADEPDAGRALA